MTRYIVVLDPHRAPFQVPLDMLQPGEPIPYSLLRDWVGGYVARIHGHPLYDGWVDDEGGPKGLPLNLRARHLDYPYDLYGPAVITERGGEHHFGLTQTQATVALAYFA